jgi:preprotein translocase subunit SecG
MDLLITLLYLVFVFTAIVLIVVILLQEGRGGGFGTALGEGGQQTFGVGARGINQFTGYAAVVFLGTAIVIHILTLRQEGGSVLPPPDETGISAPPAMPQVPPPENR